MVDLATIDERVAAAIPGDEAAGVNARYEEPYEALSDEMAKLESLNDDRPEWPRVAELAMTVLADLSKDMMAAAWLAGALWETDGYAGLRGGLSALRIVLRDYWDNGFPSRLRARRSAVSWICDRAMAWAEQSDPAPTRDDLVDLVAILGEMYASTEDKWEGDDPPIWQLQKRFQAQLDAMPAPEPEPVIEDSMPAPDGMPAPSDGMPAPAGMAAVAGAPVIMQAAQPAMAVGQIASRADAFRVLKDIAGFIEKTEPHSPIVPLLRRAVHWSELSFEELYGQLLQRYAGSMAYMWDVLGLDVDEVPGGAANLPPVTDGPVSGKASAPAPARPAPMPSPSPEPAASPAPSPQPIDDDDGMPPPTIL